MGASPKATGRAGSTLSGYSRGLCTSLPTGFPQSRVRLVDGAGEEPRARQSSARNTCAACILRGFAGIVTGQGEALAQAVRCPLYRVSHTVTHELSTARGGAKRRPIGACGRRAVREWGGAVAREQSEAGDRAGLTS